MTACLSCCANPAMLGIHYCAECWRIVPLVTQQAYTKGQVPERQMTELVRLRRMSCRAIGGGRKTGVWNG